MNIELTKKSPPTLHTLGQITLHPLSQARLNEASATAGGDPSWRARKIAEGQQLLALGQLAPERIRILDLDLRSHFRAVMMLNVPVPCQPEADGRLVVIPAALLGLDYAPEAVREPLPGYAFFTVIQPHGVWHANVSASNQALCLGASLAAGIRVRSLIQMAYGALSMQTTQIDPGDSAGVMNNEAAAWWQQNFDRVPLSRDPFLPATSPS